MISDMSLGNSLDSSLPVYILCTGSSLSSFDFNLLVGKQVIAVNHAYKFVKDFHALVAIDYNFYESEKPKLMNLNNDAYAVAGYFQHMEVFGDMGSLNIHFLNSTGVYGYSPDYGSIRFGFNSGYTAIGLAVQLGAKDIRVMGMDLSPSGSRMYFYDGAKGDKEYKFEYSHLIRGLRTMRRQLPSDVSVVNYSEISLADAFPKRSLDKLFE